MSETVTELEQAVTLALKLSPLDKIHLVEQIMATLGEDFGALKKKPKRSLFGILSSVSVSEEDIAEARREMWGNFPREDI